MFESRCVELHLLLLICLVAVSYSNVAATTVQPGDEDWGYIEVRPGARMFYWLYFSTASPNPFSLPLVMWLQGGPGASSTRYGNFEIIGPLNKKLEPRNSSWVHHVNVLFIDNPVGAGYSHVEDIKLLTQNNKEIADDLVTFTKAFYKKYSEFEASPLAIFGESYGGKMNIDFALELDKVIKTGEVDANLKVVAIGDGWVSPIDATLAWAPYLLNTGMVDMTGYAWITSEAEKCKQAVQDEQWSEAFEHWWLTQAAVVNATKGIDFYNILEKTKPFTEDELTNDFRTSHAPTNLVLDTGIPHFLRREFFIEDNYRAEDPINEKLKEKVPDLAPWGKQSSKVFATLKYDFMKPVTDGVEQILNTTDIDVIVYNGQLDLIVSTPGQVQWVDRLEWPGKAEYVASEREPITIDGNIEGYIKKVDHFSFWWMNRAGHMAPRDNTELGIKLVRDVCGLPPIN